VADFVLGHRCVRTINDRKRILTNSFRQKTLCRRGGVLMKDGSEIALESCAIVVHHQILSDSLVHSFFVHNLLKDCTDLQSDEIVPAQPLNRR
jgi:hypothetical protein